MKVGSFVSAISNVPRLEKVMGCVAVVALAVATVAAVAFAGKFPALQTLLGQAGGLSIMAVGAAVAAALILAIVIKRCKSESASRLAAGPPDTPPHISHDDPALEGLIG